MMVCLTRDFFLSSNEATPASSRASASIPLIRDWTDGSRSICGAASSGLMLAYDATIPAAATWLVGSVARRDSNRAPADSRSETSVETSLAMAAAWSTLGPWKMLHYGLTM
jgi:hypothetical protein